jgi:hypothetical protein
MTILKKVICVVAFSFVCLLYPIGYAQLTNNLLVNTSVSITPPSTVYITDVMVSEASGVSENKTVINYYSTTLVSSSVVLGNNKSSYIVMQIAVFNNTTETYGFSAVKYAIGESTYDNDNISIELLDIKVRDQILAKQTLYFHVKFYYKDNNIDNNVLNSMIQYEFLPINEIPEDSGQIVAADAMQRFEQILNTPTSHNELKNQLDDYKNNDRLNSSYIGNLTGSSEEDLLLVEGLFEDKLLININGVQTEITLMIKRENLDGDKSTGDENGNEMTIYMTTNSLNNMLTRVKVYAATYTKLSDSEKWIQIGGLFEGDARVNGYDGSLFGTGSFNTDTWESTNNETIEEVIAHYDYKNGVNNN